MLENSVASTHAGIFHEDEVNGSEELALIAPGIKIIRSDDPEVFEKADLRLDQCRRYCHENGDHDHHQEEGAGYRESNGIAYATAGLIWKHYGLEVIKALNLSGMVDIEDIWRRVDWNYFVPIDANDTGDLVAEGIAKVRGTEETIRIPLGKGAKAITDFNGVEGIDDMRPEAQDERFHTARKEVARVRIIAAVKRAMMERLWDIHIKERDTGSPLILCDMRSPDVECVWTESACDREHILYAVFPSSRNDEWRLKAIPIHSNTYELRRPLPAAWGGLDREELDRVTGVKGCVFCHRKLFIAGTKTREAALELAEIALRD